MSTYYSLRYSSDKEVFEAMSVHGNVLEAQRYMRDDVDRAQDVPSIILAVGEKVDEEHVRIITAPYGRTEVGAVVSFVVPSWLARSAA